MQLNPKDIVSQGILRLSEYSKIQQVGADLTVSEDVGLKHGESKEFMLNEHVKLPSDVYATLTHRSTYNRKGVLIVGSIYDAGYFGQVGCTIYNMSGEDLHIEKNTRVAQMLFFRANSVSDYNGQYQDNKHLRKSNG